MNKSEKKLMAVLFLLGFLTLGLTSASAITIEKNTINEQDVIISKVPETIAVYRYGPDGSVKSFEVNLELEEGKDFGDALIEQCDILLENDKEIQKIVQQANNKSIFGFFTRIQSTGKGFHYKTLLLEKLYLRYLLWKFQLPRITSFVAKPFVFCRYGNDLTAKTIIQPILWGNKTAPRIIEGTHSVFVNSFIGYSTWIGRFSYSAILPRTISGYGRFAFCNKI